MKTSRLTDITQPLDKLHANERLKAGSNFLRGTIAESLDDALTYAVAENDTKLLKFFGIYQQDDRDLRDERRRQKLEPAYQFMVRLRLPGGVLTPQQWLKLDELAHTCGNGTLRITDRQTFQFHGILKPRLRPLIQGFRDIGLDTRAACGDDNRGVMASTAIRNPGLHRKVYDLASAVSAHLRPRTSAYSEIWYGEKPVGKDEEPLYGPTYLPRKFKIAFAVPPTNDVDIYTPDLGFIAIADGDELLGFNVVVGGGMGRTDNAPATYPRLGNVIGFVPAEHTIAVAEAVVTIQRDYGNRVDRTRARFKYTIDDHGLDWFVEELQTRLGFPLEPTRPYHFDHNTDEFGWIKDSEGLWHYVLFVQNGRLKDDENTRALSGLRAIAGVHTGEFRLTPNQNVIISRVAEGDKAVIDGLLADYRLDTANNASNLQKISISCVAFPTCGLAMAESERYLPSLLDKIQQIMATAGIADQPITIRMSGCPNGCSRPYIAEIGFTGRAPGKYNVYLGGGHHGQRLNKLFLNNVGEETILAELAPIITRYAKERTAGEPFGDFVIRAGYVPEVKEGRHFND